MSKRVIFCNGLLEVRCRQPYKLLPITGKMCWIANAGHVSQKKLVTFITKNLNH